MRVLFTCLLPLLLALPAVYRLRALRAARRRALVSERGWRWLLAGLAAALALAWLAQLALIFDTRPELPLAGLAAVGLMLAAGRLGRAELHPGLRGLRRPMPRDGLDIIERETHRPPAWRRALERLRPLPSLLPALFILSLIAAYHPQRLFGLALLALLSAAPLLLAPYRRQWLLPLGLALPLGVLLAQALARGAPLPAGLWAAPISPAHCPGVIRAAPEQPRAWCADADSYRVYAFDPASGRLAAQHTVSEAARLFAANGAFGWVQQIPARGLVRVQADDTVSPPGASAGQDTNASASPSLALAPLPVASAHKGAADQDGRLWVIDVSRRLSLIEAGQPPRLLDSGDGLLNNTANVVRASPAGDVWVGSIEGASVLPRGSSQWQVLGPQAGAPPSVMGFAFGPDEAVWLLWQARPGYGAQTEWGISRLLPGGQWLHLPLGEHTQLEAPRSEEPLAIDRHGRAWFVTQSLPLRERYLGIAAPPTNPGDPLHLQVHALGAFPASGHHAYGASQWRDSYGVIPDGAGGILLFDGRGPWRRWIR